MFHYNFGELMNLVNKINNFEILDLIQKADKITLAEHGKQITLERAIFLSWWCDKGDCLFCYMSSQKSKIKDPLKARRNINSILAEAELCRRTNWKIEFLSGGYGSFSNKEIKKISEKIYSITGEPVWLNIGITKDIGTYGNEVAGITGAVEVANPDLHHKICPSKSLEDIAEMLEIAGELGFKKAITIILGLGETPEDLIYLHKMIDDLKIDRITFYSLNPHKETSYENTPPPASLYYAGVVAATRIKFPKLKIITGTWIDNLANIGPLLLSGANGLTKFPLFKMYGTRFGKRVEDEVYWAGKELIGTFTDLDVLEKSDSPNPEIEPYIKQYINKCIKNR
jgi:biotin synthase-like enzyme